MDSEFFQEEKFDYTYYGSDGSESQEDGRNSCAYLVKSDKVQNYYVKFFRGRVIDPYGMDSGKIKSDMAEYKKVQKDTFNFYVKYLETRKSSYLSWAERSHIDV
jgi:hypothetical protein